MDFDDVFRPGERRLTIKVVAERLDLNPQTVRDWITSGKMRALRIGHSYFVTPKGFTEFVEACSETIGASR